ncbi:MAG: rod shape-determining protein RodA [Deltaproteobacteria bacterium]|nr:rod shape-determining protein RodA [Deltaproteobacteria bacterium]MBW1958366.1 rod shape-determining protein RodA [Deltaproteobacteria bacterium]MBW2013622.1 rod shape-determining protein RodA [Deltaproteobacteria bacterium]MBW2089322.1 rod shape-determining protein RodA [Deltaproteobacteria bacterium]MBW2320044.1 rod shape-determining protein RodA [Deltaproteobacteria bacterium]
MFDRRFVKYFDWGLLGLTFLIGLFGLITLYSAVISATPTPEKTLYFKQIIWYGIGMTGMVLCFLINYKSLYRWSPAIYAVCIVLLIYVLMMGKYVGGARRWLILGPISIQPSELVKIAVIISLARYYSKFADTRGFSLRGLLTPLILTAIPFILIVRQPDLGTAMVVVLIAGFMTVFVKIERRSLLYLITSCTITGPLIWFLLKGYQKERILTFINPNRDPLGAGYHIIQSKIAIGSGMIFGKGFLKGTQNALSFLPEQHTDFIFSVLAEEWGFVGSVVILSLFLLLIIWGLNIAHRCRDPFGTILAVGVTAMMFWQVFINVGMAMGLMPIVGVTLPFISYGGSSIVSIMICVGLLMSISMRRFLIE